MDKKNYEDLTIYFTRYVLRKSTKIRSLQYHELPEKIERHERKTCLMINDYMLDQVLDKIKETIGIVKLDDSKIFIDTVDKLADYVILKNVVILITCVIKGDAKFFPQIFLKETLYNEKAQRKALKKISEKLLPIAWHTRRWWDFCMFKR